MTNAVELLVLVTGSIGVSMMLSRLALGQFFVLVQMANRQQADTVSRR